METRREGQAGAQEMMDIYKQLAAPSEQHKKMARMEGIWEVRTKAWMDPNQPPTESRGTAEFRMILGGRYQQQEFTGEMMGTPFKGIGFMGYDNHTKKFVSTWMDSMSTSIMCLEGTASPDGKTITQTGHYDDPIQGPMDFRAVTTIVDDNTLGFEMYGTDRTGNENKMMEMVYTRRE